MTMAFDDDHTKPLLLKQRQHGKDDGEGWSSALENGTGVGVWEGSTSSLSGESSAHHSRVCIPPAISKVDILEGFESGSSGSLQTDAQTVLNTVSEFVDFLHIMARFDWTILISVAGGRSSAWCGNSLCVL